MRLSLLILHFVCKKLAIWCSIAADSEECSLTRCETHFWSSLFRLLTNELNSLIWAKMSTDEYLSSPIKQSQRSWCECNVILMWPKVAAPDTGPIIWLLSSLATPGPGSPLSSVCWQIFVLSSLSRSLVISDHSRPFIDHPIIRENWQEGFNEQR